MANKKNFVYHSLYGDGLIKKPEIDEEEDEIEIAKPGISVNINTPSISDKIASVGDRLIDSVKPSASPKEPDYVSKALEMLSSPVRQPYTPGEYVSPYADKIDALINDILGTGYSGYDPKNDPTYSQYKKTFLREADRTQEDVLGEYAGLTGGMPSTAAITAASQAGNQMRGELADIIPQLSEADYNRFLSDLGVKRDNLSDLLALENDAYGKFSDQENRKLTAWELEGAMQDDAISRILQAADIQTGQKSEDNAAKNAKYDRVMELLYAGVLPSEEELESAGISSSVATQLRALALGQLKAGSVDTETAEDIADENGAAAMSYDNALEFLAQRGISASGLMNEEQFEEYNAKVGSWDDYEDYVFDFYNTRLEEIEEGEKQ